MSPRELQPLLDALPDTCEVVLRRVVAGDGVVAVWRVAAEDARTAYARWCGEPSRLGHAVYLAAADQADAALASLRAQAEPLALAPA